MIVTWQLPGWVLIIAAREIKFPPHHLHFIQGGAAGVGQRLRFDIATCKCSCVDSAERPLPF